MIDSKAAVAVHLVSGTIDATAARKRGRPLPSGDAFYEALKRRGYGFGPSFRRLREQVSSESSERLPNKSASSERLPIKMLNDRILVTIEAVEGERRSSGGIRLARS